MNGLEVPSTLKENDKLKYTSMRPGLKGVLPLEFPHCCCFPPTHQRLSPFTLFQGKDGFCVLLLLFNAGSIALGVLPYFYGPTDAFQIAQIIAAGAVFILAIILPCFVVAKRGNGVYTESFCYLLMAAIDIVASVFITLRWVTNHQLSDDYRNVPQKDMVVIMVVAVSWAAALTGAIGFILSMIDACSRAIRRDKHRASLPIQTPPRELRSAPFAHPHTTYMRPGY
ncbi:uncharacterized protein FOMMEDRAFT_157281 [Fomitiporia mediterranea MF3/22]|uniref:uncharacterized protein n=1 Tax=Fomitiporia mediterranea (strain MF3/22) TaxID=694068 RepID=UPI0004407845|nr:uncharacterized protein FOMMEDRAFT_157281 [Fomitiporia mediterranea MF3/22]EJD02086.1 hypothetical protein FOMMEDRAFT_157281 [Fomitiporia mediterranea MF3/22]